MNRSHAVSAIGAALAFTALFGACSSNVGKSTSTTATTTSTSSQAAVTTAAPTTAAPTTAVPTTSPSKFPDFAAYAAALPAGTELCDTMGTVTGGNGTFGLGGSDSVLSMVEGQLTIFCPGAKLTVGSPFTGLNQFGDPLQEGDLFSVKPDGSYVQLSSF